MCCFLGRLVYHSLAAEACWHLGSYFIPTTTNNSHVTHLPTFSPSHLHFTACLVSPPPPPALYYLSPPINHSQVGLNGVDNGAIRFSHVRVPRVNLLDRFASVDKSGRYSSPLTSEVQ